MAASTFAPRSPKELSEPLTDESTLEFTVNVLTEHFDLQAAGYCCQTRDLFNVLVAAAARGSTIEATCNDLADAPDSNTVRGYLTAQLSPQQIRSVEAAFNRALGSQ